MPPSRWSRQHGGCSWAAHACSRDPLRACVYGCVHVRTHTAVSVYTQCNVYMRSRASTRPGAMHGSRASSVPHSPCNPSMPCRACSPLRIRASLARPTRPQTPADMGRSMFVRDSEFAQDRPPSAYVPSRWVVLRACAPCSSQATGRARVKQQRCMVSTGRTNARTHMHARLHSHALCTHMRSSSFFEAGSKLPIARLDPYARQHHGARFVCLYSLRLPAPAPIWEAHVCKVYARLYTDSPHWTATHRRDVKPRGPKAAVHPRGQRHCRLWRWVPAGA